MKKILTLLMICALVLVTGCGGGSDNSAGKLSVILGSNVVSLDSAKCTDSASFEVIADCIDGLMQLDADGKPIPALAESFDVSEDGKTHISPARGEVVKRRPRHGRRFCLRVAAALPTG